MQWVTQTGGSNAVTTTHTGSDADGHIYSIGFFSGTIDLDPGAGVDLKTTVGSSDIFIVKTDAFGQYVWGKTFGSSGADEGLHIAVDGEHLVACGFFLTSIDFDVQNPGGNLQSFGDFDAFVLQLDTAGQFVWVAQLGGGFGDIAHSLAVDLQGNVIIAGQFSGTADFDPSPGTFTLTAPGTSGSDGFAVKLDGMGQLIWAKQLGGTSSDLATEVSLTADGSIYVGGSFRTTADMDPGTGTYFISSNGGDDAFVAKLDSLGQFIWAHGFGSAGFELCNSLTSDPQGGVVLAGPFQNSIDADPGPGTTQLNATGNVSAYLIRLDSAGQFGFAKAMKGTANVTPRHIRTRSDGTIYLCGNYNGTTNFDLSGSAAGITTTGAEDAFLLSLDETGNTRWLVHFGSTGSDDALGIHIDPSNALLLSGKFAGTCDFNLSGGGPILTPAASRDGYIIKLSDPLITGAPQEFQPQSSGLYPNPTTGVIHLREPTTANSGIILSDAFGRPIWISQSTESLNRLDLNHLPAGVYFLDYQSKGGRTTERLLVVD